MVRPQYFGPVSGLPGDDFAQNPLTGSLRPERTFSNISRTYILCRNTLHKSRKKRTFAKIRRISIVKPVWTFTNLSWLGNFDPEPQFVI
jgi:hypothetical protein